MELEELDLDKILKHDGVRGMKWGVVKWRKPKGEGDSSSEGLSRPPGRIKQELDSMKREREWKKVMDDFDNLTDAEVGTATKRLMLENEFKKLAKGPVGSRADKRDYRLREEMTDSSLNQRVVRLRAKNALNTQVSDATKKQREIGQRVVQTGGSLLIKYAMNKQLGKKMSAEDVYESIMNPKAAKNQAVKSMLDTTFKKLNKK